MIAIFPVKGNPRIAEDELHQVGKPCLRSNIVGKNDHAALTGLDADHGVGGLSVVATLVKTVALGAIEDDNSQPRSEIFALLLNGQVGRNIGNRPAVARCRLGLVISPREAALSPSPRTRADANLAKSVMVVFIDPATRTFLRWLWA